MQHTRTPLADRYIKYALSTASAGENQKLETMPDKAFMAVPLAQRSVTWLGHCIQRSPGYVLGGDVVRLLLKFESDLRAAGSKNLEKFERILGEHPELYSLPVPRMWLEWASENVPQTMPNLKQKAGHLKNGYLIEQPPDGKEGMQITIFAWGEHNGLSPERNEMILSQWGRQGDWNYQINNMPSGFTYADEQRIAQNVIGRANLGVLCALMILKRYTNIFEVMTADEWQDNRGTVGSKSLHEITFNRSPTAVDFSLAKLLTAPEKIVDKELILSIPEVATDVGNGRGVEERSHVFLPRESSSIPQINFSHQIHGIDEWYVNNDGRLQSLTWLLDHQGSDRRILNPYMPAFKPSDLVSIGTMEVALQRWHEQNVQLIESGFCSGSRGEALKNLAVDLASHKTLIPEYLLQYTYDGGPSQHVKPIANDTRDLLITYFQNEKIVPPSFAVIFAHYGIRFVVAEDGDFFIRPHPSSGFVLLGSQFVSKLRDQEYAAHLNFNHFIAWTIGKIVGDHPTTSYTIGTLSDELPSMALELKTGGLVEDSDSVDLPDVLSLFHGRQSYAENFLPLAQHGMLACMKGYRAFIQSSTTVAMHLRPDLNNALERALMNFFNRNSDDRLPEHYLAFEPTVTYKSEDLGAPSASAVQALITSYKELPPSIRHSYGLQPIAFLLAGEENQDYAKELKFQSKIAALVVGADYLNPRVVRGWFTSSGLREDEAVTIENLNETQVSQAIARGLIVGTIYSYHSEHTKTWKPKAKFPIEEYLKRRVAQHYIDTPVKRIIVASVIGEICTALNSSAWRRKLSVFQGFSHWSYTALNVWKIDSVSSSRLPLPVGTSSFTINRSVGLLTQPQIRFFEIINCLMGEMRITPAEMDAGFQFEALRILNGVNLRMDALAKTTSSTVNAVKIVHGSSKVQFILEEEADTMSRPFQEKDFKPKRNKIKPSDDAEMQKAVRQYRQSENKLLRNGFVGAPLYATSEQRRAYQRSATAIANETTTTYLSDNNILQAYASGRNLLPRLYIEDFPEKLDGGFARPTFGENFVRSLIFAVEEFVRYKYGDKEVPKSIQELRFELDNLLTAEPSFSRLVTSPLGEVSVQYDLCNSSSLVVFKDHDALYYTEVERKIATAREQERVRVADLSKQSSSATSNVSSGSEGAKIDNKKEGSVIGFSGAVVQRVLREAGKSHPNNSPEREDDIARMRTLAKKLKIIHGLVT